MSVPLLTSVDCTEHVHLVIGDNSIAAKRVARSLEAGALCILVSPNLPEELHFDLQRFTENKTVSHIQRDFEAKDLKTLGRPEVDRVVDMVFVTLSPTDKRGSTTLAVLRLIEVREIFSLCKRLRIPINCADSPSNCTFSLLATHRDGPLQIGVSTSGKVAPDAYFRANDRGVNWRLGYAERLFRPCRRI
jgi:uroporphyrin-III C-methyltransferase